MKRMARNGADLGIETSSWKQLLVLAGYSSGNEGIGVCDIERYPVEDCCGGVAALL